MVQDGEPVVIATGKPPDNDNDYPRINTCCPCMDCLDDCIRQAESGGEGNPTNNPDHVGCNANSTGCNTGLGCDCGPYQIDHADYIHDICGPVGPCSNGDGGYDNSCCEVCANGYGNLLCATCPTPAYPDIDACCAEKTRRSLKLIDCFRRRYTRNPSSKCSGSGTVDHPTDPDSGNCFTCEDIARMHNGGPCGHKKNSTIKYWDKVKRCMEEKCGYIKTGSAESCGVTDTPSGGVEDERSLKRSNKERQDFWERYINEN